MPSGHRKQFQLAIHVFVAGRCADAGSLAFQKSSHQSVTGNSFSLVVGFGYAGQKLRLFSAISCFSVPEMVVVSVRKYSKPLQLKCGFEARKELENDG